MMGSASVYFLVRAKTPILGAKTPILDGKGRRFNRNMR